MKKITALVLCICMVLMACEVNAATRTRSFLSICANGTPEEVEEAIKRGADVNVHDYMNGNTTLNYAIKFNPNLEVIKILVEAGADVNSRDKEGYVPLIRAIIKEPNLDLDIIKIILNAGANVDARDNLERTALMCAAGFNPNPEVIKVLIQAGADIDARNTIGITALMFAAGYSPNPEVIKVLIQAGADIEAKAQSLDTPLMFAARFNDNPEILRTLIECGADVKAEEFLNRTALAQAVTAVTREKRNPEIVDLLIRQTAKIDGLRVAEPEQNNLIGRWGTENTSFIKRLFIGTASFYMEFTENVIKFKDGKQVYYFLVNEEEIMSVTDDFDAQIKVLNYEISGDVLFIEKDRFERIH